MAEGRPLSPQREKRKHASRWPGGSIGTARTATLRAAPGAAARATRQAFQRAPWGGGVEKRGGK